MDPDIHRPNRKMFTVGGLFSEQSGIVMARTVRNLVRDLTNWWDDNAPLQRRALLKLPDTNSCSDVARRESLIKPIPVGTTPRRKRLPMPHDTPQARQAARIINRSKVEIVSLFEDFRLGRNVQIDALTPIVSRLSKEIEGNALAMLEVLRLKNKSEYTYLHSVAVSTMMLLLGRAMGYTGSELADLGLAGLLHDVGKMGVPSRILDKPDRLSDAEFASVKAHPSLGRRLLDNVVGIPLVAKDVCFAHHEKIDGAGYPLGLKKHEISVAARMGAVCDVYDALTSDRAYKAAWTPGRALASMRDWPGHFDPDILAIFMQTLGIYPVGSLVSVRGKSLGIVLRENHKMPTRPIVRTFYSMSQRCFMHSEDVAVGSDGLLAIQDPDVWGFTDWPALTAKITAD